VITNSATCGLFRGVSRSSAGWRAMVVVVVEWLKRTAPSLALDLLVISALAFPGACAYLRWPLLGIYALVSVSAVRRLRANPWLRTIVRDPTMRIIHGLEHAALAVLTEDELPALGGFTHGHDRFVVALGAGQGHRLAEVSDAVARSIRRVRSGERSLAYQPGCGTSEVVSMVSLWLVYVTCVLLSLVIGGSIAVFVALSVITFRMWFAWETALGLLAQRLFTVSTDFVSASVIEVREVAIMRNYPRPDNQTWFEVVVHVQVASTHGELITPGVLG